MKKLRILMVVAAIVTMLFTIAYAADSALNFGTEATVSSDGSTVTINVYAGQTVTIKKAAYFNVKYDPTIWTYDSLIKEAKYASVAAYIDTDENWVSVSLDKTGNVDVTTGDKIVAIKFTKTGTADVNNSTITFDNDNYWRDSANTKLAYSGTITVVAEPAGDPKPAAIVSKSEGRDVVVGKDHTYGGIWIGKYVVNANDETISGIKLDFSQMEAGKIKTYSFPTAVVKGNGNVNCNIAIVGVPSENYKAPVVTLVK